jgi:hypothetical protein
MRLRGRPLSAWIEPRPWELALARLGLPLGQPQCAPHLLSGDVLQPIDPAAMLSLLQDGSVLTPAAVTALLEMGWGERIGVLSAAPAAPGVNEWLTGDELNGSWRGAVLPVRQYAAHLGPHTFELAPSAKARVLSHWVDVSGVEQGPAAVALELPGGERLGLLPFEIQSVSPALLQMARREQWASLFEWAGREVLPIRVTGGENVYPIGVAACWR